MKEMKVLVRKALVANGIIQHVQGAADSLAVSALTQILPSCVSDLEKTCFGVGGQNSGGYRWKISFKIEEKSRSLEQESPSSINFVSMKCVN